MSNEWVEEELGFLPLISRFVRRVYTIGLCMALAILGALAYLVFSEPLYTAETTLLLASDSNRTLNADNLHVELETHAKLIRSDVVIAEVLRQLDPDVTESIAPSNGLAIELVDRVRGFFSLPPLGRTGASMVDVGSGALALDDRRVLATVPAMRENLSTSRHGQSLVLRVSYTSSDPVRAVEVANAFVDVYTTSRWSQREIPVRQIEPTRDILQNVTAEPQVQPPADQFPSRRSVLEVVSPATLPTIGRTPNVGTIFAVFGMIGFLAGVALVIRQEWTRLE